MLIDDRTGRVVRRQSMSWWPLADGRRRTDLAGHNSFRFTGRVGGHKLKPGAYRLQAIPSLNGRAGIARVTSSKIVR